MSTPADRARRPAGVRDGGQFAAEPRQEVDVRLGGSDADAAHDEYMDQLAEAAYDEYMDDLAETKRASTGGLGQDLPVAPPDAVIVIDDADDPFGTPLYEGRASGAAGRLRPGTYSAADLSDPGVHWRVVVPEPDMPAFPPSAATDVTWTSRSVSGREHVLSGEAHGLAFVARCEATEDPEDPYSLRIALPGQRGEVGSTYRLPSPSTRWRVFSVHPELVARETAASRDEAVAEIIHAAKAAQSS